MIYMIIIKKQGTKIPLTLILSLQGRGKGWNNIIIDDKERKKDYGKRFLNTNYLTGGAT